MAHFDINARRLFCPIPVIRLQDKVVDLQSGDTIEISCTDMGAEYDIPAWCRVHGHQVLKMTKNKKEIIILVEVQGIA